MLCRTHVVAVLRRVQVYEPGGLLDDIRNRVKEFMGRHNEEFPAKKVSVYERTPQFMKLTLQQRAAR